MDLEQIDVFIDEKGEVRLEVRGVKGKACLGLTAELESALGGKVQSRELTPEAQEDDGQPLPERQQQRQTIE